MSLYVNRSFSHLRSRKMLPQKSPSVSMQRMRLCDSLKRDCPWLLEREDISMRQRDSAMERETQRDRATLRKREDPLFYHFRLVVKYRTLPRLQDRYLYSTKYDVTLTNCCSVMAAKRSVAIGRALASEGVIGTTVPSLVRLKISY